MPSAHQPHGPNEWVILTYRLPREPSTPRITLWRRLKRLGAAQLADGVAALPGDARTREQLEWLAEDVLEAGGTAGIWVARPGSHAQERALAAQLRAARAQEYAALTREVAGVAGLAEPERARAVRRVRRLWREIGRRDFFPPTADREAAAAALHGIAGPSPDPSADRPGETERAEVPAAGPAGEPPR